MQYASMRDLQAHTLSGGNTLRHFPVYGRSRLKHAVSEGFMTLAENMRPEANLLIGVSQYALQRHERVIIYVGRVSVSHQLNL